MGDKTARSYLRLEYNKCGETEALTDDCLSWSYTDNASGKADTIDLTLSDEDQKWLNNYYPEAEDKLMAWIEVDGWFEGGRPGELLCGSFMVDSFSAAGLPHTATIKGISVPVNADFAVTQKDRTWKSMTLFGIASDIASSAGIGLAFEAADVSIEEESQSGKTDEAFLFALCSERGLAMKLFNDKIVIFDMNVYEQREARHTINQSDCEAYTADMAIVEQYDSVKMQYTNGKKEETLTYQFAIPGTPGRRTLIVSGKADSIGDAETKAKASLREKLRAGNRLTCTMQGNTDYIASDCCNVQGFGRIDGKYFIDTVTHSKSGAYKCTLDMHRVIANF